MAAFGPDVDQLAVWDECVTAVKADVAAAVDAINPRFHEWATESSIKSGSTDPTLPVPVTAAP